MRPVREPIWKRAWRDTERFRGSWWWWLWEAVGLVGLAASFYFIFVPEKTPSRTEEIGYPAIGAIVGALGAYLLTYLLNFVLTPVRQRDEAWEALAAVPGSTENPITPQAELFIRRNDDDERIIPAATLARAGRQLPGGRIVNIPVQLSATHDILVEQVQLEIAGEKAASSWESNWVTGGTPAIGDVEFQLPEDVSNGEHKVRLIAYAEQKWWASNSFPMTVPPVALPENDAAKRKQ